MSRRELGLDAKRQGWERAAVPCPENHTQHLESRRRRFKSQICHLFQPRDPEQVSELGSLIKWG